MYVTLLKSNAVCLDFTYCNLNEIIIQTLMNVYLTVPGLQRIANKLNIDCAAAITGFEYSTNGWSYPVKDGFVVCEEFKDILLDAFNQV